MSEQKLNPFELKECDLKNLKEYSEQRLINHERVIVDIYLKAFECQDLKTLEYFASFGPTIRHRVMNVHSYQCNLIYGFNYRDLNEHNWLKCPEWVIETIDLSTKNSRHNELKIGKTPNNKFTYSWSLSYGYAGSSSPLSTFSTPFNSREAAIDAALNYAKSEFKKGLLQNTEDGNYNHDLIKATLKLIDGQLIKSIQTTLF